ncbi:MAG TPA: hypothetical protein VF844_22155 [Ktedonobacteraceae bacterium]
MRTNVSALMYSAAPHPLEEYEVLPSSEEAWIYLAMIRTMLRCLAQTQT